ncbi:hypothetical protein [Martelella mangrovi]|uniref:Uncharacterized protein n=1 Tax=Martelella mangrovi TaxID=1397477 RepID=A0ABV2IDM2_9HYPH
MKHGNSGALEASITQYFQLRESRIRASSPVEYCLRYNAGSGKTLQYWQKFFGLNGFFSIGDRTFRTYKTVSHFEIWTGCSFSLADNGSLEEFEFIFDGTQARLMKIEEHDGIKSKTILNLIESDQKYLFDRIILHDHEGRSSHGKFDYLKLQVTDTVGNRDNGSLLLSNIAFYIPKLGDRSAEGPVPRWGIDLQAANTSSLAHVRDCILRDSTWTDLFEIDHK